jgi:phenylpropionate dioxygenase-like ring-hydroxylating dioxygenase large terminal subunit
LVNPAQSAQISRLLPNRAEGKLDLDEREHHLSVSRYTSEERFRREREILFRRYPLILGTESQFEAPGTCLTHDLLDLPLLLVRGEDGVLRAFLNVCRHRGTRIVSEDGLCHRDALTCPYHNWTYGLDGRLKKIPRGKEGFPNVDPAAHGLVPLPLLVRHGLVWVLPDRDAAIDVDAYLGEIGDDLEELSLGSHRLFRQGSSRCKANWKLMIDAFSEVYHVKRLHSDTIGPFFLDTDAVFDRVWRHLRAAIARKGLAEAADLSEVKRDLRNNVTFTYFLFPNSVLVFSPDYVTHLAFFPQTPDETVVVDTMLVPHKPRSADEEAHWARSFDLINEQVFRNEDYGIAEAAQIGIRSGANEHLTLGRLETGVRIFHEVLDEALAEWNAPV